MTKEQILEYLKMAMLVLIGIIAGILLQRGLDDGGDKGAESVAIYITMNGASDSSAEVTTKVGPDETKVSAEEKAPEVTRKLEPSTTCVEPEIKEEVTPVVEIVEEPVVETVSFTPQPISREFDILTPSGYTAEQLKDILSDDLHKEMIPHVDAILEAEKTYGVNALYLLCKLGLESGWGKYESGENNIGGWTNNKGGYKDFASTEECVMHIAKYLSTSYKDAVGTKLGDVCKRYCPDDGYTELLLEIMTDMENKLNTTGV